MVVLLVSCSRFGYIQPMEETLEFAIQDVFLESLEHLAMPFHFSPLLL